MKEENNPVVVAMRAEGNRPDDSWLDNLPIKGIDAQSITVVNCVGNAWERPLNGGEWVTVEDYGNTFYRAKEAQQARILAITPFHPKYGIRTQTLDSIRAMLDAYTGPVDWILTANDNPHKKPYENVVHHHNKAREMVLSGDYDALLSIEADMVVPPDAIDRLLATGADIAYGLYVWRGRKIRKWNTYTEVKMFGGINAARNMDGDHAHDIWGKVIDVAGMGMGCTLIRREVLETLRFRLYEGHEDDWLVEQYGGQMERLGIDPYVYRPGLFCDDYMLALDAQHHGFVQLCDLGVVCGHIYNGDVILWPDPDAPELYREETIRS